METLFASIDYRDPVWILSPLRSACWPPTSGCRPWSVSLVAGFVLNGLGAEGGAFLLRETADLGVTPAALFDRPASCACANWRCRGLGRGRRYMALIASLSTVLLMALAALELPLLDQLEWPIWPC